MTTTGPRATLTSSAPCFIRPRNAASTSPRVSLVPGTIRITTSALREQVGQLGEGVHAVAGGAGHPQHVDLEGLAAGARCRARCRRTRRSARSSRPATDASPGSTVWSFWSPTNPGMPRSEARVRVSASSAVEALWIPRPLHSSTPSGTWPRTWSTPAVSVWTTFRRGIRAEQLALLRAEVVRRHVELAPRRPTRARRRPPAARSRSAARRAHLRGPARRRGSTPAVGRRSSPDPRSRSRSPERHTTLTAQKHRGPSVGP